MGDQGGKVHAAEQRGRGWTEAMRARAGRYQGCGHVADPITFFHFGEVVFSPK
ncbi:hypothetical protein BN2537_475 [Streptomyces venezuelae]|nr:hypothetical protein BN2537_475 [Streptomyces venezuelae]